MTIHETKVAVLKLVNNLVKAGEYIKTDFGDSISVGTNLRLYPGKLQSEDSSFRLSQVDLNRFTILIGDDAQFVYDEVMKLKRVEISNLLANQ